MPFSSQVPRKAIIITDSTPERDFQPPPDKGTGLRLGLRQTPFGGIPNAPAFPRELLIPRSEWEPRIKEMEETQSRISDLVKFHNIPCKDQAQTNYCWINAPCYLVELTRMLMGLEYVELSPASGGARIKNFRNQGGWGEEALTHIAEYGLNTVKDWPANAWNNRRLDTAASRESALRFRVTEWMELQPRNMDEVMSCLLHRLPGASGLNWWGHEVSYEDPLWIDNAPAVGIRNSWGKRWGEDGYGILQGERAKPDDYVVPRQAKAA
jgi:hypothetical protein